ncbi:V-set and transmembrane domain-containing protein 2A [Cyclopterus lumpus]|uniref:V-set and transmembrane domain-containing protein 2A n=1 Tax=Cyclopterus lumpus TaxID=8103 RepID=UPI0014862E7F|nr:V-set and transmembrane domain-containing protein 2A [Cyclopterus lumpus]
MMWTSHDSVGLVFFAGFCVQLGFSFEGRFTDMPSNMTVKEGQNIEMVCAFQSGTASVYLEIQWWFVKAPEPTDSEEEVDAEEMEMIAEPDPDDDGTKISTVKVQGNDISHKLQISRVSKGDEGLYECRVTRANYGEIVEYKVQAWLRVNATARPRRPLEPPKKSSPLHLTDKKPRKSSSPLGQDSMSSDQRVASTSTSHTSSNTAQQNPGSDPRKPNEMWWGGIKGQSPPSLPSYRSSLHPPNPRQPRQSRAGPQVQVRCVETQADQRGG